MREFVELDTQGVITLAILFGIVAVILGIKEIVNTIRYNKKTKQARMELSKKIAELKCHK